MGRFDNLLNQLAGVSKKDNEFLQDENGHSITEKNMILEARDQDLAENPQTITAEEAALRAEKLAQLQDMAMFGMGSINKIGKAPTFRVGKGIKTPDMVDGLSGKNSPMGSVKVVDTTVKPQTNPKILGDIKTTNYQGPNSAVDEINRIRQIEIAREELANGTRTPESFQDLKESFANNYRNWKGNK